MLSNDVIQPISQTQNAGSNQFMSTMPSMTGTAIQSKGSELFPSSTGSTYSGSGYFNGSGTGTSYTGDPTSSSGGFSGGLGYSSGISYGSGSPSTYNNGNFGISNVPTTSSNGGAVDIGTTLDPALTSLLSSYLGNQIGTGLQGYGGQLTADPNTLYQSLYNGTTPGQAGLQSLASTTSTQLPGNSQLTSLANQGLSGSTEGNAGLQSLMNLLGTGSTSQAQQILSQLQGTGSTSQAQQILSQLQGTGSTSQAQKMLSQLQGTNNVQAGTNMLGGNNSGNNTLQNIAQNGINVLPGWQSDVAAQQQNIAQNQAQMKEQFAFAGGLAGTPFGNALSNYQSQTAATQNQNLTNAALQYAPLQEQAAATLAGNQITQGQDLANIGLSQGQLGLSQGTALGNLGIAQGQLGLSQGTALGNLGISQGQLGLSQGTALGNLGISQGQLGLQQGQALTSAAQNQQSLQGNLAQMLQSGALSQEGIQANAATNLMNNDQTTASQMQGIQQADLTNNYNEWLRTQAAYNPLLTDAYGLGTTFPPYITSNYGVGAAGGALASAGSALSGIGSLISGINSSKNTSADANDQTQIPTGGQDLMATLSNHN
jgi:hypothetical protein